MRTYRSPGLWPWRISRMWTVGIALGEPDSASAPFRLVAPPDEARSVSLSSACGVVISALSHAVPSEVPRVGLAAPDRYAASRSISGAIPISTLHARGSDRGRGNIKNPLHF